MRGAGDRIAHRDRFVLDQFIGRRLPAMILLWGGFRRESYQLIANMAGYCLEKWGQ